MKESQHGKMSSHLAVDINERGGHITNVYKQMFKILTLHLINNTHKRIK